MFEDIIMDQVKNPIIVDENYCFMDDPLKPKACKKRSSGSGAKQYSVQEYMRHKYNKRGNQAGLQRGHPMP
jgi:hypothetical protein